jgi:hypothetical protein
MDVNFDLLFYSRHQTATFLQFVKLAIFSEELCYLLFRCEYVLWYSVLDRMFDTFPKGVPRTLEIFWNVPFNRLSLSPILCHNFMTMSPALCTKFPIKTPPLSNFFF